MYDVFLSYSSLDRERADLLEKALVKHDVSVWRDRDRIDDLDHIPAKLIEGIENTRLTVALASGHHAASNVCRWEVLYSLAVGDRRGADRLRLVLTEDNLGDYSAAARARRALRLGDGPDEMERVAGALAAHLSELPEPAADQPSRPTGGVGAPGHTGDRFVGRLDVLMDIHDALAGPMRIQDAGVLHRQPVFVVHGMGGVGKSLLAMFYAEQFGGGYPAGSLWLPANGDQVDNVADSDEAREMVFRSLTDALLTWARDRVPKGDIDARSLPVDPAGRWTTLRDRLDGWLSRLGRLLVVVDDVPAGVRLQEVVPPGARVSVLVTSRDTRATQSGYPERRLEPLTPDEGMLLLAKAVDPEGKVRRAGDDPWRGQRSLAESLVEAIGGHPLALDLLTVRLKEGEPLAALAEEVDALEPDFIDAPDYFADLPSAHKPSILATIASSVRGAAREGGSDVLELLRVLSVLPAGNSAPESMIRAVLGGHATRACKLAVTRSLAGIDSSTNAKRGSLREVRCHALTRAVVRRLWESGSAPYDDHEAFEPRLSRAVARWLHAGLDQPEGEDWAAAAADARICLEVLDGLEVAAVSRDRVQRAEALLALARERYRVPGSRTLEDYEEALGWVRDAQQVLQPAESDWEAMTWHAAAALEGILRGQACGADLLPELTAEERLRRETEAFDICAEAERARQTIGSRMLSGPDVEPGHAWVEARLVRGLFNLPGRRLAIAKSLACVPDSDLARVREHLRSMDSEHEAVIARRCAAPEVRWGDVASSVAGRGMAAYYQAVLGRYSLEERRAFLHDACAQTGKSLQLRRDRAAATREDDVGKSLGLLLKVALARLCLEGDLLVARETVDGWIAAAEAVVAPLPRSSYVTGPVDARPTDEETAQHIRDKQSCRVDDLMKALVGGGAFSPEQARILGDATVTWVLVARRCGMSAYDLGEPLGDFFGPRCDPSEGALLLRPAWTPVTA